MPTPRDTHRTKLFRRWLKLIGDDLAVAQQATGIAPRTLERMRAGTQPPPTRLLDQLAADATARGDTALAGALAAAALPGQVAHA